MRTSHCIFVALVLCAAGAHAANPVAGLIKTAVHQHDVTQQLLAKGQTDGDDALAAAHQDFESSIRDPVIHAASTLMKPVTKRVNSTVMAPIKAGVEKVANRVQKNLDHAAKLLPQSKVDTWKTAVLLAWLKESGVYDLLNGTLPSLAGLPADLAHLDTKQARAAVSQLNSTLATAKQLKNALMAVWLKDAGVLDALAALQNSSAALKGSAQQLPAFNLQLPVGNMTVGDLLTSLPIDALQSGNLTALAGNISIDQVSHLAKSLTKAVTSGPAGAALDKLKSAVLLSWLRDSGAYEKLQSYNKVADALNAAAANATERLQEKLAKAQASLEASADEVVEPFKHRLDVAGEVLGNLTKQTTSLRESKIAKATNATRTAERKANFRIKTANDAVANATRQIELLRATWLHEAKEVLTGASTSGKEDPDVQERAESAAREEVAELTAQVEAQLRSVNGAVVNATKQVASFKATLSSAAAAAAKAAAGATQSACQLLPAGKARQTCYNSWVLSKQKAAGASATGSCSGLAPEAVQDCVNKWVLDQQQKKGTAAGCATAEASKLQDCVNSWIDLQMKGGAVKAPLPKPVAQAA